MPTRAKRQIEERILADEARENIALLSDFLTVLTKRQLRAIVEVFYGIGVSRIKNDEKDKIIVWNNEKHTDFKYHFSAWEQEQPESATGIIPNFFLLPSGIIITGN